MKARWLLLLTGLCLLSAFRVVAQPSISDDQLTGAPPVSVLGISILGNPSFSFKSVEDYQNGVSLEHNTLSLAVSLGLSWALQVRATDDLRYQSYSIPASAVGLQVISLGNRPEIRLGQNNQLVASGLVSSLVSSLIATIRYRAQGGNDFLKPGGSYTTTLVFSYTAL